VAFGLVDPDTVLPHSVRVLDDGPVARLVEDILDDLVE